MFEQSYELPLSADYVKCWGVVEAVREIAQNCLDSDSPFEWSVDIAEDGSRTLTLSSRHSSLEPRHLILGSSSKSDNDDQIGQFGEGFKLAMLVLTRAKKPLTILNSQVIWTPEFSHSKKFGADILKVVSRAAKTPAEGLHFIISGLDPEELSKIYYSNLHMQEYYPQHKPTTYGNILMDDAARLFVNGLFVCDIDKENSYDIKPEHLKLDRDRRGVASFDLDWTIANMWKETGEYDYIAEKMEAESPDMAAMKWNDSDLVKDACYKRFITEHGEGNVIVSSQAELDELAEEGIVNTVYCGDGGYYSSVSSSKGYKSSPQVIHRQRTPTQIVEEFFSNNRQHMRTKAIVAFKREILSCADKWKLKQ